MTHQDFNAHLPSALPGLIPVFPLPDHILLPGTPSPYRIFEPRYLAMIRFLLGLPEERRYLAVPRLRAGWEEDDPRNPPFHEIATVGLMVDCFPTKEGHFHIVVDEGVRCLVHETPSPYPFRMAQVEAWPDAVAVPDPELETAFDALVQLVGQASRKLGAQARGLVLLAQEGGDINRRVFRLGGVLVQQVERRQMLLESRNLKDRIDIVLSAAAILLTLAGQKGEDEEPPS